MQTDVVEKIQNYFKNQPIQRAWLFGSFSRGEERKDSDVDILIQFVPGTKMGFQFAGLVCDLEDLLHRDVDLVVDGTLLPYVEETVNKDKKLIYERTL